MPLPSLTVTGTLLEILGDVVGGELNESVIAQARVEFESNVPPEVYVKWEGTLFRLNTMRGRFDLDGELVNDDGDPMLLLAQDDGLNVRGLQWRCRVMIPASVIPPSPAGEMRSFWFNATGDGTTIPLGDVVPVVGLPARGVSLGDPTFPWGLITGKPLFIAAGSTQALARQAIDLDPVDNGDGSISLAGVGVVSSADPVKARELLGLSKKSNIVSPLSVGLYSAAGSLAIQFEADSTGNEDMATTPEWIYLLGKLIATAYPNIDTRYLGWDDVNQLMKDVERLGPAPATLRYVDFPGGGAQRAYWTGAAITGDLDIQAHVTPNSWANGAEQTIVACHSSSTDRSWFFGITADGQLSFQWSTDGAALKTAVVSGAWAPSATQWVRARFQRDNGTSKTEIKLYRSADGVTWTQLGATVTRGQVDALFNAAGGYQLACRSSVGFMDTGYYLGKMHEIRIRDGLDGNGKLVAPALPEHWTPQQYCTGGQGTPVLTIVNGSHPGADLVYLADPTRLGKMTPNYGQVLAIISASHNEGFYHNAYSTNRLQALADAIQMRLPACPIGVVAQNPRVPPAPYITPHAQRRTEWMAYARAKGWYFIDAYKAIIDAAAAAGTTVSAWTKSDGVHPYPPASAVWAQEAFDALGL